MTLVVTHRLRVAALADRVLLLAGGRIAEAGSPADLIMRGGTFAEWCRLQRVEISSAQSVPTQVKGGV